MLITHALQGQKVSKGQTSKRKIKHIITTKNPILQPSIKNLNNPKIIIQNKQNQNPNIRKSPSPSQQKPSSIYPNQQKQTRIKSQYYTTGTPANTRQSPIKKILFVKNLCYKSTKTSKNSSLDNKKDQFPQPHNNNYLNLGGAYKEESGRIRDERRSYSHYNSTKSFAQNQSEIFVENRLSEKPIKQFRPKDMISHNNQSQASYRLSPNELHTKMTQFNQKYTTQPANHQNSKSSLHKLSSVQYTSSLPNDSFLSKNIKMCPNIESPDLNSLESFKNNKYLLPSKIQSTMKALISMDKEKKESLSSKKRNSRIKVNYKNSQKHRQSFNEQNITEESQMMVSSPSHPLFEENHSKNFINNDPNTNTGSHNGTKSTSSKEQAQQSTLIETKKFDDTFQNLNSQMSKGTLNESKQLEQINQNSMQRHSVKHYCSNHPQKQAKFKVNKEVQKPYYCSKCTVLLVTQGYKVVQNMGSKNNRLEKLKTFIFELEILQPRLKSSTQHITQLQSQITSLQSQAQKQIQTYYTTLINTLQTHKQTAIKSLNYHTSKVLFQLESLKKKLSQNEEEMNFMKSDILPNVDLIVDEERLPEQSWKQIIMEHQQKLEGIEGVVEMISKVLEGQGEKKIMMKSVQIPQHQIKSALNTLERTQIVFTQKIVKLQPLKNDSLLHKGLQNSPANMDQTKRSFSFDQENIDTSFYIPSQKKKHTQHLSPQGIENIYELTDSIRMSFGNRFDSSGRGAIQSPTFKAI